MTSGPRGIGPDALAAKVPDWAVRCDGAQVSWSAADPSSDDPEFDAYDVVARFDPLPDDPADRARWLDLAWARFARDLAPHATALALSCDGASHATWAVEAPRLAVVDGRIAPADQATLPITDVQVTHGLGVYETLEAGTGLDDGPNLARLADSAAAIGVAMPDLGELRAQIAQITAAVGGPAWVRINLSGSGRWLVWAQAVDPTRRHRPVACGRAPHVDHPLLAGAVKSRSRGPWMAELRRRSAAGAPLDELLFVDRDGRFTEGTSCAVVAVVGGAVVTAPWDGRLLRSTTLERILARAERLGVPVVREGPRAEGPWDALYIASTTRDLAPVAALDGVALAGWDPIGRAIARARTG